MKHKCIDPSVGMCKPKEIMNYMQMDYGVSMSYKKAWRSREQALKSLYGNSMESYAFLPKLRYMIETKNPGSLFDLVTGEGGVFISFFMSLGPWRTGWKYVRPVIIVDGTHLKNYYKGTLYTACGMDGNKQIFPLAYCIGPSESNETWIYFFAKLKDAIGEREEQVFVSDRHAGIINGIKTVFPNCDHGFCMYHLHGNLKTTFKGITKEVKWKFYGASKAYTQREFESFMVMLDAENPEIRRYLANDVGYQRWARCMFRRKRYGIMTNNNAEALNALNVKVRQFPVSKLMDWLRERSMKWFYERRDAAAKTNTLLTKVYQAKADKYIAYVVRIEVNGFRLVYFIR